MKIVVVEDSAIVRDRVIAMLNALDGVAVVGFAEDADPAIQAIDATQPDLVVLDIGLKTSNGRDVLSYLVREHPQTKVFVLSNQADDEVREVMLREGATRFFDKSSDFFALRDAISEMSRTAREP